MKKLREVLDAAGALFGFAGWLTTRKKRTVMSASDEAGNIVDLISKFMKANNLTGPPDGWDKELVHPKEERTMKRLKGAIKEAMTELDKDDFLSHFQSYFGGRVNQAKMEDVLSDIIDSRMQYVGIKKGSEDVLPKVMPEWYRALLAFNVSEMVKEKATSLEYEDEKFLESIQKELIALINKLQFIADKNVWRSKGASGIDPILAGVYYMTKVSKFQVVKRGSKIFVEVLGELGVVKVNPVDPEELK